ncbi:MAG: DsrE family protein [Burkholderiales bacterium]|nr:DsrE family protein [Burkholderiales bacterium]
MNCQDTQTLVHAYLDYELDLMTSLDLERHLQDCGNCRALHAGLKTLRDSESAKLQFHAAPAALRQRIAKNLHVGEKPAATKRLRAWQAATAASVLVAALAAWVALPSLTYAPSQTVALGKEKMVYHIASGTDVETALRNVTNHLATSPRAKVVVVAHNLGVDFLLRGAKNSDGAPFEPEVAQLAVRGVDFRVCQNTLTRRDIGADAVIPEARLVPSGIAEISRLQTQEGYAYMRL